MAVFTKLTSEDVLAIEQRYALTITSCKPLMVNGFSNSNFLVETANQKYILTVVEEDAENKVKLLVAILLHFQKHNFETNKIILDILQNAINTLNGKPYFLKNYIEGAIIEDLTLENMEQAGQALAKLHQVPLLDSLPIIYNTEHPKFRAVIGMGFDEKYENWLAQQIEKFKPILRQNLPKGIIHGDLFHDNVIFNQNGATIIDFECGCYHFLVFDIGMSFLGMCLDDYQFNATRAKAFLKGYQTIRKLEPSEIDNLQIFAEYAATMMSNWRFWTYNWFRPTPERATWHWLLANAGLAISSIPKEDFFEMVLE